MRLQRGFGLLELVLTLVILSALMGMVVRWASIMGEKREAIVMGAHVERVITQLQMFQFKKKDSNPSAPISSTWPATLLALGSDSAGEFWIVCSNAEAQSGKCKQPTWTPWGMAINYHVAGEFVTLTIPVSAAPAKLRVRQTTELLKTPYAKALANGDVEITVKPYLQATAYDAFVRRDGSTSLTADWDVGDRSITNTKGIYARNVDGSQSLISGSVQGVHVGFHGERISKPACPANTKAQIQASFKGIMAESLGDAFTQLTDIGVQSYDRGREWELALNYQATLTGHENSLLKHYGEINTTVYCLPSLTTR